MSKKNKTQYYIFLTPYSHICKCIETCITPGECILFSFYGYHEIKCSITKLFCESQGLELLMQKLKGKS